MRSGFILKLVIQIPAYNEESTIGATIAELPRQIPGVDRVEVLVMDDGSADATSEAARKAGADRVVRRPRNRGLARTFRSALDESLAMGADVIVNTDADNQYNQKEIPSVIRPILEGRVDIVLTDRNVRALAHMPRQKRVGNVLATQITRLLSGVPVRDAQSGFRAFNKKAAAHMTDLTGYTYTQETIIIAAREKLRIQQIPCEFRPRTGTHSRLTKSIWKYAFKTTPGLIRAYLKHRKRPE